MLYPRAVCERKKACTAGTRGLHTTHLYKIFPFNRVSFGLSTRQFRERLRLYEKSTIARRTFRVKNRSINPFREKGYQFNPILFQTHSAQFGMVRPDGTIHLYASIPFNPDGTLDIERIFEATGIPEKFKRPTFSTSGY